MNYENEKAVNLYESARNGTLKKEILAAVKELAAEPCEMIENENYFSEFFSAKVGISALKFRNRELPTTRSSIL